MSDLGEFARRLHEEESGSAVRPLDKLEFMSKEKVLTDVRAVICDVYGTLIDYWRPGFDQTETRTALLMEAFRKVADRFSFTDVLKKMNEEEPPQKTLSDLYNGLIALSHEKELKKGTAFPEVKIEEIWSLIVMMLKRWGYDPSAYNPGAPEDFARYLAYSYNFYSLGRRLYPGVVDALVKLKENNVVLGILSNAQFYTPIDLSLLIREQSEGRYDDYLELFDIDLTFYSYEYGVAKPNQLLFRKLYDALYEFQILPGQTVFAGNDLSTDIKAAADAGMRTAFFAGDRATAFLHDLAGTVTPDITYSEWSQLPSMVSFHGGEQKL